MDNALLNKIKIEELKTWKEELENELNSLKEEVDSLEEKFARVRVRHSFATKVDMSVNGNFVKTDYLKNLDSYLKTIEKEYSDKKSDYVSKVKKIHTMIQFINIEIGE